MKTIKKQFETMRAAENYLSNLYSRYSYARLVNFPRFSENGIYIFYVSK